MNLLIPRRVDVFSKATPRAGVSCRHVYAGFASLLVACISFVGCAGGAQEQLFFPVCIYGTGSIPEGEQMAKTHGFNTIIVPPKEADVKKASELGLKAIVRFGLTLETVKDDAAFQKYLNELETSVRKLKDDSTIIAWYVADEPD